MLKKLKDIKMVKRVQRNPLYSRLRQYFPMAETQPINDRGKIDNAEVVKINWPDSLAKPRVGVVQDLEEFPRWTKYCRFLENNAFPFDLYNIHASDWLEKAADFDLIIGIVSCELYHLEEMREKYHFLETYLGKACYPSPAHAMLYEDKRLEAYICKLAGLPFAEAYISYDKADALKLLDQLTFPVISKIVPSSGSYGVEMVRSREQCRNIIRQAFSTRGRSAHTHYFRQKNYVYFQDFIPNDGYDIRVIMAGNWAFGYYRKVLEGDFRASGMNMVEKRSLPEDAIRLAWKVNQVVKSPMLVVDMLHGLDGQYYIIEYSPVCQMETPEQLHVDEIPGYYEVCEDQTIRFQEGRYWVHELALREFLVKDYLPRQMEGNAASIRQNGWNTGQWLAKS